MQLPSVSIALAIGVLFLCAPARAEPAPRLLRLAVTDLAADGVDPRVARLVTSSIVVELRKREGVTVVGMDEMRSMLAYEAEKQSLGCTDGAQCFSKLGEALGVDQLVSGEIAVVGDESVMTLRRIDQAAAKPLASLTQRLAKSDGSELLAAMGPMIAKLFPELHLRKGAVMGASPELALTLNPPPLPIWATATTGVVAAALVAAGAVAGASALSQANAFQGLANEAKAAPVEAVVVTSTADSAQSWALTANALFVGAAVVAAGAGVMALFTDWNGARDAAAP